MPHQRVIYKLEIELLHVVPRIFREMLIPADCTFWDLHLAIQNAMGWEDCHLHIFRGTVDGRKNQEIGIPHPEDPHVIPEWELCLSDVLKRRRQWVYYLYDFGDTWEHKIFLRDKPKEDPEATYPTCTGGARACPPEDSGGPYGYQHKLDVMRDPNDEDYDWVREWMGEDFDAEAFNAHSIQFQDSKIMLRNLLKWQKAEF